VLEAGARDMVIEMGFSLLREDFFLLAGKRFCNTVLPFSHEEQLTEGQKEIKEILQCIIRERELVDGEMSGWPSANRLRMTALLFSLAAAMVQHLPMIQISSQRGKQLEAMMAVQSVLEYVEQAYPEEITLERAAGISGYEKTRFCQLFKKAVGISFHKYLNERRIRAAVFLLQGTNLPISQIARTVGVGEPKTLSRLIREAYGMTASQLREQRPEEEKQIQENR
jgi:AraC-like DNA-binding protein